MKSFGSVIHKGKRICVVDISNSQLYDAIKVLQDGQNQISKLTAKSALILSDITDSTNSTSAIKEFISHNTPYVKAFAVVGAKRLRVLFLKTISVLIGREIKSFKNRNEALDWLATK
ncbi:MAG: STAS/SEC14 domain-containing protein [Ignavibacteriales bacterium]|nr:STAS/SEC14 domain-containing protein [Ignavibacteriales bacterium]